MAKMEAKKLGKLEGKKLVGIRVDSTDARCYVELRRANGEVEKAELKDYQLKVDGHIVSRHYGHGE